MEVKRRGACPIIIVLPISRWVLRRQLIAQTYQQSSELGRFDVLFDEAEENEVAIGGAFDDALNRELWNSVGAMKQENFSVARAAEDEELLSIVEDGPEGKDPKPDPKEQVEFFVEDILREGTNSSFFYNLNKV